MTGNNILDIIIYVSIGVLFIAVIISAIIYNPNYSAREIIKKPWKVFDLIKHAADTLQDEMDKAQESIEEIKQTYEDAKEIIQETKEAFEDIVEDIKETKVFNEEPTEEEILTLGEVISDEDLEEIIVDLKEE